MQREDGRGVAVVIDDEPDARGLIQELLKAAGFDVVTAENGARGLDAIRANDASLVTLDLSMPGIDGFAILQQIRAVSTAYVVIVTVSAAEGDLLKGLESGADAYVVKPLRPREFRARVEALLRRPRELVRPTAPQRVAAANIPPTNPDPPVADPVTTEVAAPVPAAPPQPAEAIPEPPAVTPPVVDTPQVDPPTPAPPLPPSLPPTAESPAATDHDSPAEAGTAGSDWERFRGLALNRQLRKVLVDDVPVDLDADQFEILITLLDSGRRLRTRSEMSAVMHGRPGQRPTDLSDQDRRAVDDAMAELLIALGEDPEEPRWIETVPGVGYRRVQT